MKRQLFTIALLLGGVLAFAPSNAQDFGNVFKAFSIGKKAVDANRPITPEEEAKIGYGMAANLLGAAPLVKDPELQRYVNRVGRWLAKHTEQPDLAWKFGVIDSPDFNAFSMPGGTILITQGLYQRMRDESELAGVLAHEISHVLLKHQIKAIQSELGKEWTGELAGAAIEQHSGANSQVLNRAFSAGTELWVRGLDKHDEFQADIHGVIIAARSGYNPYGLVGVLQTIDAAQPKDGAMALLFATHPSAGSRIEALSTKLGEQLDVYADQSHTPGRMYALK